MDAPTCAGRARFAFSCDRKPTVVRDGKSYCWQHDPERLSKIAKEKWEARKVEMAANEAKYDARIARRKLEEAAGTNNLTDDELRAIIGRGGIRAMLGHTPPP